MLSTHIHADGRYAEVLWAEFASSTHHPRISEEMHRPRGATTPRMEGSEVFKHAVTRMPEVVEEALAANGLADARTSTCSSRTRPTCASPRWCSAAGPLRREVVSNIDRYGNTTAATIPIALAEAVRDGRLERGDLLCMVAFGSGFTWGSALVRW